MGLFGILSPRAVAACILVLSSLAQDAVALPSAKAPWVRNAYAKKKMHDHVRRAVYGNRPRSAEPALCSDTIATSIAAPKSNVWKNLADYETAAVVEWLFQQPDLNLTITDDAGTWDNTIQLVEAMWPNKTDALAYLDGTAESPVKYAHVVLNNRATEDAHYADILVGPLPIDNATAKWEPLTFPWTKQNGGRVRNLDADTEILYTEWINKIGASIADITLDLWNATAVGLENDTLAVWGIDPLWQDDDKIIRWDTFWRIPSGEIAGDALTLLPLGLYFSSDVTGRDPSKWKIEGWLYNSIFYETTEAFRQAYWSEGFVKLAANDEGFWSGTDQHGEVPARDTAHPPTMVAPAGNRFGVDDKEQYVEWMDFSFYIGFTRDVGMSIYDIKYKGERLIYELGLQEALAHYAGSDPMNSGTAYLDTFYGFGPFAFQLLPNYDCPSYAHYLNTSFYVSETTHTHVNSICLFEYVSDFPMQRHTTGDYISVTKNTYFAVRSVSTVGNYDYTFTYSFFLDGSIAVEVRASGYIQSAYFANNQDYGYQIHDALSGSMHDHVLNFKADFDILGVNNSVQLVSMVPVSKSYPWSKGKVRNTMAIERAFLENEDQGRFNWAPNSATQVIVINEEEKNKFGEFRGYRVLPYTGAAHLTVQNSTNLADSCNWAGYDIQISVRKDTEYKSAHPWNSQDVHDPPINFDKFFDGENLRGEDLVLWLNLGMHHIPHSGDLPNTVMTTAHSGIQFMPSNYFEGDQSRKTVNQVRVNYADGAATNVETFGQFDMSKGDGTGSATCKLDFTPVDPDYGSYMGDFVVRKFPFDPNNPYFETDTVG